MGIYENTSTAYNWKEQHLYGSSRLGMLKPGISITGSGNSALFNDAVDDHAEDAGNRLYDLTNHLGNVMVTVSDIKLNPSAGVYLPSIVSSQDYFSFGSTMPGRQFGTPGRYGFNGKEKDSDIGEEDYDYGMRIHDGRLGRFLSTDPLTADYPWYTPYQFAGNTPIQAIDLDGEEPIRVVNKLENKAKEFQTKLKQSNTDKVVSQQLVQVGVGLSILKNIESIANFLRSSQDLLTAQSVGSSMYEGMKQKQLADPIGSTMASSNPFYAAYWLFVKDDAENLVTSVKKDDYIGVGVSAGNIVTTVASVYGSLEATELKSILPESEVTPVNNLLNTKCFVAGTKVLSKAGLRNIENIVVGDSVWSYNDSTGEVALNRVEALFRNSTRHLVKLTFDNETVWTTPEHRFWISNRWMVAKNINVGDSVLLFTKFKEAVTGKSIIDTTTTVYNFQVSKFHSYYVSNLSILVHNDCVIKFQGAGGMFGGNQWINKGIHADVVGIGKNVEIGFKLVGDDIGVSIVNYQGELTGTQRTKILAKGNEFLGVKKNLVDLREWFTKAKSNGSVPQADHPMIDRTIEVIDKKITTLADKK